MKKINKMIMIPINKKVKNKLKSFPPEQIESIIKMGCRHFSPVEISKPLDNISVSITSCELQDKIAELSLLKGVRQSAVIGSILTTYCSQFSGTEKLYQSQLHYKVGGTREVATPVGYIDLLNDTYIVEVKEARDWKHAVGQIICYDFYKPKRQKVIALFGKISNKLKGEVEYCCSNLNIDIWWL